MNQHPILFSTEMVQAILQGRKTQTRRIVKDKQTLGCIEVNITDCIHTICPYGQIGDVLWVRETWCYTIVEDEREMGYIYKADGYDKTEAKWKPSIHMPKEACRLKLRITDIRVEKLQDITHEDSVKEGVIQDTFSRPKDKFEELWQSINGEQSWNDNPWVWAIEFEKI